MNAVMRTIARLFGRESNVTETVYDAPAILSLAEPSAERLASRSTMRY